MGCCCCCFFLLTLLLFFKVVVGVAVALGFSELVKPFHSSFFPIVLLSLWGRIKSDSFSSSSAARSRPTDCDRCKANFFLRVCSAVCSAVAAGSEEKPRHSVTPGVVNVNSKVLELLRAMPRWTLGSRLREVVNARDRPTDCERAGGARRARGATSGLESGLSSL